MRALATMAAMAAVLCGCTTAGRSYMTEIDGEVWDGPVSVVVPNSDTLGLYDLGIAVRHDGRMCGSRVEMIVRTVTPDSLWVEERLTMTFTDDGRSRSSQHEAWSLYRHGVRLAREGDYRIVVTPQQAVHGVAAVGIDVSQSVKE